nr:hypothetical protein CFP56_04190 [Quercus suber]
MLIRHSSALLLTAAATVVQGFEHSNPFFMVASEPLAATALESRQIATAHDVETQVLKSLGGCGHQYYFVVSQPGLTAVDIRDEAKMPRMRRRVAAAGAGGMVEVPEVVGELDAGRLAGRIAQQCSCEVEDVPLSDAHVFPITAKTSPAVIRLHGEHLGEGKMRTDVLSSQDAGLDRYINNTTGLTVPYVVIYTSASAVVDEPATYEMDEPFPELHADLKRHVDSRYVQGNNTADDAQAGLPLFERYQFLSPGTHPCTSTCRAPCADRVCYRYLHGTVDQRVALPDPVRGRVRDRRVGGVIYGVQQGDGTAGAEGQATVDAASVAAGQQGSDIGGHEPDEFDLCSIRSLIEWRRPACKASGNNPAASFEASV